MRKYAFEIKYLPIGTVDEFDSESIADNYNLKHYLCKPGAVYADKIIAQSENMKKIYIKKIEYLAFLIRFIIMEERNEEIDTISVADPGSPFRLLRCFSGEVAGL